MPVYFLVGPAAALIGIVAIWFVMRNRQTQKRSMYSSRRAQVERKVKAARQRTLAPHGHTGKAPTDAEIAAAVPGAAGSVYEVPSAPARPAWETPATPPPLTPAPAYAPQAPAYEPPAYEPPPPPPSEFAPAAASAAPPIAPPSPFAEPAAPAMQPEWTPAPAEPEWTPAPAPPADLSAAPIQPMAPPAAAPEPVSTPAGGGASWEIVGDARIEPAAEPAKGKKDKDKDKDKGQAAQGSPWQLASGDAPNEGDDAEEGPRKPNAAMALAQYAVLVVGLVMVLIGVLVMVANSKVT